MMDVYSLEWREVCKNTTLVFSVAFRRSLYKTCALFVLISKIDQFCFVMTFAKKARIFNKVDNVTRQLESSRTLHGSPASFSWLFENNFVYCLILKFVAPFVAPCANAFSLLLFSSHVNFKLDYCYSSGILSLSFTLSFSWFIWGFFLVNGQTGLPPARILNLIMFVWILIYHCLFTLVPKSPNGGGQLRIHLHTFTFSCKIIKLAPGLRSVWIMPFKI